MTTLLIIVVVVLGVIAGNWLRERARGQFRSPRSRRRKR
jgi:ABC-type phosphate transport system permease subunit